jgi:hypothetical protein
MGVKFSDLPDHVKRLIRASERKSPPTPTNPPSSPPVAKRAWSNAKPTEVDGIRFPSKTEARVYRRLKDELVVGERRYCQVRFPLLAIGPVEKLRPLNFTVDFVIVRRDGTWRVIDAKTRRVSREWARGKAAFEATYNVKVEEVAQ